MLVAFQAHISLAPSHLEIPRHRGFISSFAVLRFSLSVNRPFPFVNITQLSGQILGLLLSIPLLLYLFKYRIVFALFGLVFSYFRA